MLSGPVQGTSLKEQSLNSTTSPKAKYFIGCYSSETIIKASEPQH